MATRNLQGAVLRTTGVGTQLNITDTVPVNKVGSIQSDRLNAHVLIGTNIILAALGSDPEQPLPRSHKLQQNSITSWMSGSENQLCPVCR